MGKQVLNIEKEREKLSPLNKKYWDETREDLEVISREMNLTPEQKEAIIQTVMAEIRYDHIIKENDYLSRTKEFFGQRAINKNRLEMQRMKHVCEDNHDVLKDVREQINNRFAQLYNERKQETAKAKTNQ